MGRNDKEMSSSCKEKLTACLVCMKDVIGTSTVSAIVFSIFRLTGLSLRRSNCFAQRAVSLPVFIEFLGMICYLRKDVLASSQGLPGSGGSGNI